MTDLDIAAFDHLPEPPGETLSGPLVLVRLVDGIAFRYRWASDGLTAEALGFRPCEGAMSVGELLDHLRFLARWLHVNVARARAGEEPVPYPAACEGLPDPAGDPAELVAQTLRALSALRADLATMSEDDLRRVELVGGREPTRFPVWNLLNGPLSDALTHIGQLASWRRIAGDPVARHDVFRGRPPRVR